MEFANQNSSEPAGRHRAAEAYFRVAIIQSELGKDAEAKGNYTQALAAFRRLAAEFPNEPDYRCSLARCLTEMAGGLHKPVFDTVEENFEAFRQAIKLQERLVAEHPTRADYQGDLVKSCARLGLYLLWSRRYDEAEKVCRPARTIGARLVDDHSTVMTYRQDLCDVLGMLGFVFLNTGRLGEAEQAFRERLDRSKQLVADFPGRSYPLFSLIWGYQNLACIQWRTQRLEDAVENLRQSVAVGAKLAADFPGVRSHRDGLAVVYGDLAFVWSQMRRVQEAEQAYRDELALWEALARDDPTRLNWAVRLGRTQCELGHSIRERGQPETSLAWYDQAIATLHKVCAKETSPGARDLLRSARGGRAVALLELRQLKAAEQAFRELEQSYHAALDLDPANHWHWFQDAPLCLQLGDLEGYRRVCREMLARLGDTDDPRIANRTATTCLLVPAAVDDLRPVLRLAERAMTGSGPNLYRRFTGSSSAEIGVYYCWFLLVKGMAHYRTGHFDDAIEQLNQALSLGREYRYFNSRSLSGTAQAFLAMAHHRLGRVAQARQALDQATELLEQPYSKIGWNWNIDPDWDNWLRFYVVHQEAEALVKGEAEPVK